MEADTPTFNIDRIPGELCEKIMDSCDVKTMTALARTSKYWDHKRSMCMYLRVVNLLKHFQIDPKTFLEFLTRSDAIISGSAALLVFCPGLFTPGDLDIYCAEEKLNEVLDFFETFTEYRSPEESPAEEELARDVDYNLWAASENYIAKVLKLYCSPQPESECTEATMVNIIAVRRIHPITSISHFHSTPVMNIITGKGVMCMYPEITLRMRGVVNTQRHTTAPTEKFGNCLNKYRERGFELALSLGKWPGLRLDFARTKPMKDIPLCAISFPELPATAETKRVPKRAVLDEELWNLAWGLSEWRLGL